jgi:hypothetical protein
MKTIRLAAVVALALLAFPASARSPVPLKDFTNQTFTTTLGDAVTLEQVKAAIIRGAAIRSWALTATTPAEFDATILVRSHTVGVTIAFDQKSFSVRYRMSENMDYAVKEGVAVIHPKYNEWVGNLVSDIRKELGKL